MALILVSVLLLIVFCIGVWRLIRDQSLTSKTKKTRKIDLATMKAYIPKMSLPSGARNSSLKKTLIWAGVIIGAFIFLPPLLSDDQEHRSDRRVQRTRNEPVPWTQYNRAGEEIFVEAGEERMIRLEGEPGTPWTLKVTSSQEGNFYYLFKADRNDKGVWILPGEEPDIGEDDTVYVTAPIDRSIVVQPLYKDY